MVKAKRKKIVKKHPQELDGVYVLKIAMYLVVGSQWIRLVDPEITKQVPLPIGLLIGGLFASHEHFQIDRKIEFAVLIIASLIGFWAQTGLFLAIL